MSEIKREFHKLYDGKVEIEYLPDSHYYYLVKDGEILPKKQRLTGVTSFTGQLDKSAPLIIWATRLFTKTVKDLMGEANAFTKDDVLAMIEKGEVAHKEAKETACGIGDYVHEFASEYSEDCDEKKAYDRVVEKLGEPSDNMVNQIQAGCVGFVNWLKEKNIKIISSEKIVYSQKFGFVGRYDATLEIDGKKYLADWKTSGGIYPEYYYQTSAYLHAYEEETGEKLDGALIVGIVKEDKEDKDGIITKKAGDIISEIRCRQDCVSDYKAFKALIDIKERQKVNVKW